MSDDIEANAKLWTKEKSNQEIVISSCIGANPRSDKLAYFMAGIPGAGKTEFAKGLQGSPLGNFINIEHDKLVEHIDDYKPKDYYKYRTAGSILVTELFIHCLKNGYSFIFDGTLSSSRGVANIRKALNNGYKVIVLYVHQDIASAWSLTKDRELDKKRAISKTGFIKTCKVMNKNLLSIFNIFRDNPNFAFWAVVKNGEPGTENSKLLLHDSVDEKGNNTNEIEKLLSKDYNIEKIEGL